MPDFDGSSDTLPLSAIPEMQKLACAILGDVHPNEWCIADLIASVNKTRERLWHEQDVATARREQLLEGRLECKWKLRPTMWLTGCSFQHDHDPSWETLHALELSEFKYCPYCGGELKYLYSVLPFQMILSGFV